MLRTTLCLVLAITQGAAGPLYVCTSTGGAVSIDAGRAACTACQPARHKHRGCCSHEPAAKCQEFDAAGPLPCDCRHDALGVDSQQVRRSPTTPSGELLVTPLAEDSAGKELCRALFRADSDSPASESIRTALADLESVCLRC